MNDSADRLIKALGDIGEDLIEKAAPVYPDDSGAGESIRTAVPAVYEPEVKITRKDRVIYWVTHSLGVVAAAILIIGAAVLLIMNWDKIAVKEPERPGAIVKYIDELPDISEAYGKTIEFSDASVRLSSVTYDGTSLNARFYILFKGSDDVPYPGLWINVEGEECAPSYAAEPVMEADSYNYIVHSFVRVSLEPGRAYVVNIEYLGNGNRESDTQEYRFTCPDIPAVTAATTTNNPYFTSAVEPLIEPDEADPFGQITDTNMPEPYDSMEYPLGNFDFYSQWKPKFFYTDLLTETDSEKRKEFHKRLADIQTPYTLFDSPNLYAIAKAVGFTSDDIENELRKRNETYSASGDISKVFSDYEIMVLSHSNDSLSISATFASEYSIYMNTYVFSPKWLYYHTIEDYKAAGIDPYSMHSLLEKYSELGLTDEAWAAFSAKLQKFIGADIPPDTFTYDRPAGSWFELEETLYHIDNTAPFDCVTFDENGNAKSIFIDEWKEDYDAIGYESELESINADNYVGAYDNYGIDVKMIENADPDGYVKRLYSSNYQDADKGEALAMRHKYIVSQLNEKQLKIIDKYMRDKLTVPYESIEWNKVYGVYYVETNKRCELMPDRYYSDVNDDLRHDLFEAMYEADRNAEMDGNPGTTYYHTNPLPIVGSDEYIGFWVSGSYNAKIIAAYIIKRDFEGQYRADMKTDITDELDRLYIDGAKLMFVKSGGGYYAVTESNRKIELIPGDEGAVSNYEAKFAYRVRPYLPLPDGAAEDIKLGEEQKRLLIKEAYESAQSFENSIPLDRLAVSDPVKISEQQFFIFVFDGDEIVGKIWCFYSDSTENASGFDTGGYDNAVDGLTELYRSGEKVSFTWFGSNLYCCPKNVVSYPIEWQVFHKPSVVYLYNAEQGARIVRNETE